MREEYRRGYVTDELTRERGKNERVFGKQTFKNLAHDRYSRHIARKDKESNESEQKSVIHVFERLSVKK